MRIFVKNNPAKCYPDRSLFDLKRRSLRSLRLFEEVAPTRTRRRRTTTTTTTIEQHE